MHCLMRPPPGWTPAQWARISAAHAARTAPDGGAVCAAAGRPPEAKVMSAPSMMAGRNLRLVMPACPEIPGRRTGARAVELHQVLLLRHPVPSDRLHTGAGCTM